MDLNIVSGSYMEYGNITFSEGNMIEFTSVDYNGSLMGKIGTMQYGAVCLHKMFLDLFFL